MSYTVANVNIRVPYGTFGTKFDLDNTYNNPEHSQLNDWSTKSKIPVNWQTSKGSSFTNPATGAVDARWYVTPISKIISYTLSCGL